MEKTVEKPGYTFAGWYIDEACTKRINPGGKLPHSVTLYDKWIPVLYPVSYDMHGGQNDRRNPQYVTVESGVFRLHPAKKAGMAFQGWMLDGKMIDLIPEGISRPITLHAIFKRAYQVTFETAGGGVVEPKDVNSAGRLEPFVPPRKLGHTFAGWFLDRELTEPFDFGMVLDANITLYAGWEPEYWPVKYHLDGGLASRTNPRRYSFTEELIPLLPARKKGHRFLGWYDAQGNRQEYIPPQSMGAREFFARWKPIKSHAKRED